MLTRKIVGFLNLPYLFGYFMNNAWFVNAFMRYTARKQHRADLLADVVAHNRKRRDLFKLLNSIY